MKRLLSILLCVVLCLGAFGVSALAESPVKLTLVIYGDANDATNAFISDKLRPRLIEDLNIDLNLQFMSWGAQDQVRTMAMSGEAFGFMFDPNANPWSADGIMATIPYEKIEELAPAYLEARGGNGFDWCKDTEGNIISIPLRSMPNPDIDGIAVRNDILNAVGVDYSDIHTWDEYLDAAMKVHEKFPDLYVGHFGTVPRAAVGIPEDVLFTSVGSLGTSGCGLNGGVGLASVNDCDPDSDEVISVVETEYFKEYCKLARKMVELGLRDKDPLVDTEKSMAGWSSGNALASTAYTQMVYRYDELSGVEGSDVKIIRFDGAQDVLKLDYNWTIAISIEDEKNVDNWLRLINWMYESKENNYFISKGEEGVDWKYGDDGVDIVKLTDVSLVHDWMIATDKFEQVSTAKYGEEAVAEYWALNDNAIRSKAMGFIFDPSPVSTENALLKAIITEKLEMYSKGFKDVEDGFDEVIQEMKDAGLDKYVAEVQKQFSEFMASK